MMMQLDGEMPQGQKDEAPSQSKEYPTVDNSTRTMVVSMLPEGAVKYCQEQCLLHKWRWNQWTACKHLGNLSKS